MVKKNEIVEKLIEKGITGLSSRQCLAKALGIAPSTIGREVAEGRLKECDRSTHELDDIVSWLMQCPRFIADRQPRTRISNPVTPKAPINENKNKEFWKKCREEANKLKAGE